MYALCSTDGDFRRIKTFWQRWLHFHPVFTRCVEHSEAHGTSLRCCSEPVRNTTQRRESAHSQPTSRCKPLLNARTSVVKNWTVHQTRLAFRTNSVIILCLLPSAARLFTPPSATTLLLTTRTAPWETSTWTSSAASGYFCTGDANLPLCPYGMARPLRSQQSLLQLLFGCHKKTRSRWHLFCGTATVATVLLSSTAAMTVLRAPTQILQARVRQLR